MLRERIVADGGCTGPQPIHEFASGVRRQPGINRFDRPFGCPDRSAVGALGRKGKPVSEDGRGAGRCSERAEPGAEMHEQRRMSFCCDQRGLR